MDYRKIIGFGKSSFVISLPKDWISKNKLKKGDVLNVEETPTTLTVSSRNEKGKKEARIKVILTDNRSIDILKTEIIASYLNGYEIIEIKGDLTEKAPKIKPILQELSGMEILEQTGNKMVAHFLINMQEVSVESLIRRMDVIVKGMIEDCIKCIHEDCADSIYHRDYDINRLAFLAYRVIKSAIEDPTLARYFKLNTWDFYVRRTIIGRIEALGDHTKRIARELKASKLNKAGKKDLEELFVHLQKTYIDVIKAFYTKNKEVALKIETTSKERINHFNVFLKKHHDETTAIIVEHLKTISSMIRNIARDVTGMEI